MASILDVQNAIVSAIAATKPTGHTVSYFPGFPVPEKLKAVLASGNSQVSVFPHPVTRRAKAYKLDQEDIIVSDVSGTATLINEQSRQTRWIQIHVWSPTYTERDVIGEALKVTLDTLNFIGLPDNTSGSIKYVQETEDDAEQASGIYHRIYIYAVEYATYSKTTTTDACHPQVLNKAGQVVNPGSNNSPLVIDIT